MSDFDMKGLEGKIEKSLAVLKEDLTTVRAGRANAALLDKVMVEYYGSPTPLKALANISVPEPRTLLVTPFDPKSIPDIEKGINIANIGINPVNDGKVIRLQIPQVTEERRKELTGNGFNSSCTLQRQQYCNSRIRHCRRRQRNEGCMRRKNRNYR